LLNLSVDVSLLLLFFNPVIFISFVNIRMHFNFLRFYSYELFKDFDLSYVIRIM
jgi:hypothetical protein